MTRGRESNPARAAQRVTAGLAITFAVVLAPMRAWPFRAVPPAGSGITIFLLDDRLTLGFLRLAIVSLALFVIGSVPALIVAGRWLIVFGTSGLRADAAQEVQGEIKMLRAELERVTRESDRYHRQRNEARSAAKSYQRIAEANLV
jgi:hypothetical protein